MKTVKRYPYIFIFLIGAVLFLPFLGQVHLFDWDEINFAESAREMLVTGNWTQVTVDYQPFWEKPPLFIWLQALSMSVFGVNEFAARLPNALVGIGTLMVLFAIGRKLYDQTFGWLWVLLYVGTFLPHLYFKSGIIDPLFNLCIFLGVFFLARNFTDKDPPRYRHIIFAGLCIGLAVLTKGPVGLLLAGLAALIFAIINGFTKTFNWKEILLFGLMVVVVSFPWYGLETIENGWWFLQEFIEYQIHLASAESTGHNQPFYYHFVVLLVGCFPASVFLLGGFTRKSAETDSQQIFRKWMIILLAVVLGVFSIIQTKIVHYSSLAYFPLTFLAATYLYWLWHAHRFRSAVLKDLLGILAFIWSALLVGLVWIGRNKDDLLELLKDPFLEAALHASVSWPWWFYTIGGLLLLVNAIAIILFMRRKIRPGIVLLFVGTMITIQLTVYQVVPRVEAYTQRTAIEFYQDLQGKDVYVEAIGFKSYAHLFYSRKMPAANQSEQLQAFIESQRHAQNKPASWPDGRAFDQLYKQWLLTGDIDKPTWFVSRIDRVNSILDQYDVEKVGEKNGFVFLKREIGN